MHTFKRLWPALFLLPILTACAARAVTPVVMSQAGDEALSCADLDQQVKSNRETALSLLKQDKQVQQANTALMAATVFSWWFQLGVDLSNEEQVRMRSLADRNQRLTLLAAQKGCAIK